MLLGYRGALLPVYDGADLALHSAADLLTLGLIEAPAVPAVLGRHLQQLAAIFPGLDDD